MLMTTSIKNINFSFIFVLISKLCFGQIELNPGIDTSSVAHKDILKFWTEYLESRPSKGSTAYLDFWNEDIRSNLKQPDLTLHAINTENSTLLMAYPTILSILPYKNNFYQIKTAMGWSDTTSHIKLLAIVNHYVKKTDDKYKLYAPIEVEENIEVIDYNDFRIYTVTGTVIPQETLDELIAFIRKLKSDFNIREQKKMIVIYGKTHKETDTILGFDFNLMSSTNNPSSGISDLSNNLIVLNGLSPIFHETTHIYLNPIFTETPLLEGLATFYGGSMGKTLTENIKYLYNHVSTAGKDVNLYGILEESYYYVDNSHNPIYTLQGLLIQMAHDKGGVEEVKNLLSYPDFDAIFRKYFNLEGEKQIDAFIREELRKRAMK